MGKLRHNFSNSRKKRRTYGDCVWALRSCLNFTLLSDEQGQSIAQQYVGAQQSVEMLLQSIGRHLARVT